jgi:hypothetical protein
LNFYIFGSDQIWRFFDYPGKVGFDFTYWGCIETIPKQKKIAYAASMGRLADFEKLDTSSYSHINDFKNISVRESSLQAKLYEKTGLHSHVVLDPVFLVPKEMWTSRFSLSSNFSDLPTKYILVYNITKSKAVDDFAVKLSKQRNIELVRITADSSPFDNGPNLIKNEGPIEFLKAIFNAAFIVSSSFHGVAFSIVFEKQFISLGIGSKADRVRSLLESLDISESYIDEPHDNSIHTVPFIEYNSVNQSLKSLVSHSKSFLSSAFKE